MKQIKFFEGQIWKTFEPDPSICFPEKFKDLQRYSIRNLPINVVPDEAGTNRFVRSNEPRLANLKVSSSEKATRLCPAEHDEMGYSSSNGVIGNFYSCRTDNVPWGQLISPLPDNTRQRAELKLAATWRTNTHKQIFRKLAELMTRSWVPGNIKIARYSSSGPPAYTSDAEAKREFILPYIPDLEWILTMASQRRVVDLYKKHGIVIAYRLGARLQPDSWVYKDGRWSAKERIVPDLMYALSNGRRGQTSTADNLCEWDPRLVKSRTRTFYGMANPPNLLLAMFFEGFNNGLFRNYHKTFQHHGAPDIEAKANRWRWHVSVDVSNHDFLVPEFVIQILFDVLRTRLDERVVDLIELMWRAPAFVPWPIVAEKAQPYWLGHPLLEETFKNWFGVPSGIFLVSFAAKFGCMGVYLCKLNDMGIDVLTHMEAILNWSFPDVAVMDMGDDAVVCFQTQSMANRFRAELIKTDYYVTGVEPNGFLGNTFFKDHPEDANVYVRPSAVSYVIKPLTRERNINSRFSPYWARGYEAREAVYRPMPSYSKLHELVEREFRDNMGYDLETAIRGSDNYTKKLPALSYNDMLALENPERVHYLFQPGELSMEIENMFSSSLKKEEFVDAVLPYINHNTLN